MLFAISGSQGSGKTTVLNALRERGFPTVERKTSRSILEEWGVTLSEVNNNRDLTIKFQDEIIKRKFEDEQAAAKDPSRIWFTERTYADLFTYALIAVGKDNEYSDWIDDYYLRCKTLQESYKHNFYLQGGLFGVEQDGVRGSNKHYATMVDVVMMDVIKRMENDINEPNPPYGSLSSVIAAVDVEERTETILKVISPFL